MGEYFKERRTLIGSPGFLISVCSLAEFKIKLIKYTKMDGTPQDVNLRLFIELDGAARV